VSIRLILAGTLAAVAVATSAAAQDPPPPAAIRFVTLNVLHGGPLSSWTGQDSHLEARLDLVTEALRELAPDVVALQRALGAAGLASTVSEDGSLRTDAEAALVGRAAYDGGVVLTELRNADSGGLEEMFLELTADTQRERTAA